MSTVTRCERTRAVSARLVRCDCNRPSSNLFDSRNNLRGTGCVVSVRQIDIRTTKCQLPGNRSTNSPVLMVVGRGRSFVMRGVAVEDIPMPLTFCGRGGFALAVCGISPGCGTGNTRRGFQDAAQTTCLPAVHSPGVGHPRKGHPGTGSAGMRIGFAGVGAHTSAPAAP